MKTPTLIAAAIASVFALGAAAPALAAAHPGPHHHKHIHRMLHRADANHDGRVSHQEMLAALDRSFAVLDTNHDGVLSKSELAASRDVYKEYRHQARAERKAGQHVAGVIRIPRRAMKHFARLDANHDGVLTQAELGRVAGRLFKRHDRNGDGYLSKADFKA